MSTNNDIPPPQASTLKKWTIRFVKVAIFIGLLYLIKWQLSGKLGADVFWEKLAGDLDGQTYLFIALALLLMPLNWGLETRKWQYLIRRLEQISFLRAIVAVLSGITLSLFTPNRVGEYGARVLLLQKADKIQGAAITMVGSMAQLIANSALSLFGFVIWYTLLPLWGKPIIALSFGLMAAIGIVLVLSAYLNLKALNHWLGHIKMLKKWLYYLQPLSNFHRSELWRVLGISALRYCVYVTQYLFLLWAFKVPISSFMGVMGIGSIFFLQTLIPSIALVELGIRGNLALQVFGSYLAHNEGLSIMAATFLLWFINLVLPALLGGIALLFVDINTSLKSRSA